MQRHGARHAQASLTKWIGDYLDGLGEQGYEIRENLGDSAMAAKATKEASLVRQVWVTVGGRDLDDFIELGGGGREGRYEVVIDVFGAPAPGAKALAEDIFELLTGMTSFGAYVPFINQATGTEVPNETLSLESPFVEQASPTREDWWQVGVELWRYYRPGV